MNKWYSLWLLVAAFGAWAQSEDITYKGVALGMSLEEYKAKLPDHQCFTNSCMYSRELHCKYLNDGRGGIMTGTQLIECMQRNTFGGVAVHTAYADFREGRLVAIRFTINASAFDILTGAAKERLGEPTKVVDRTVQTRAGAKLENREMIWERPSMILRVERYGSTINNGSASLMTPQERDRMLSEFESQKKKGAKDF